MLGLAALFNPGVHYPVAFASRVVSVPPHSNGYGLTYPSSFLRIRTRIRRKPARFVVFADDNNGLSQDSKDGEDKEGTGADPVNGTNGGDDDSGKEDARSIFSSIRWSDLLLDPDPDNIVAVGLTGLLTWASVQVLWQLFVISLAIVVAALKYSFIAALLILILTTLL